MNNNLKLLENLLINANIDYTIHSNPKITDGEYDKLKKEYLEAYEKEFGKLPSIPVSLMGLDNDSQFEDRPHPVPMLSLNNAFNKDDIYKHFSGLIEEEYYLEPKYDGVSLELNYNHDSVLEYALTRGDGEVGEVITLNALAISNVPRLLNGLTGKVSIRGEVVMPRKTLIEINKTRVPPFANCRNAASGSLRLKDASITATRGLLFIPYQVITLSGKPTHKTLQEQAEWLRQQFPILGKSKRSVVTGLDKIGETIADYNKWAGTAIFDTDGFVIKLNDLKHQALGSTGEGPRWATAFKFPEEEIKTTVTDVVYQTGRTGQVTPVLKITPTLISGVIVTSATLHNFKQLRLLNPQIGGEVIVKRAGEVIPYVVKCLPFDGDNTAPIEACGSCGGTLTTKGELTYCTNTKGCPAQAQGAFVHFVSNKGFDIDQFSISTVEQLLEKGYINNFVDIFKLTKEQLLTLDLYSDLKANKLLKAIEASKTVSFSKFVHAIGIPEVGASTANDLGHAFLGNFRWLMTATVKDLEAIDGIGPIVAGNISDYFLKADVDVLKELLGLITITYEPRATGWLTGKVVCLTGSLAVPKNVIKDLIVKLGGKVTSSVSAQTDYIMIGAGAGVKATKARELGIEELTYEQIK